MKISEKSQLGLQLHLPLVRRQLLIDYYDGMVECEAVLQTRVDKLNKNLEQSAALLAKAKVGGSGSCDAEIAELLHDWDVEKGTDLSKYSEMTMPDEWYLIPESSAGGVTSPPWDVVFGERDSKKFLIQPSAVHASRMIRIGDGYTSRTLKDIKLGGYTYLMGPSKVIRFDVKIGRIDGTYWDSLNKVAFRFYCNIDDGTYYYDLMKDEEFAETMRILTFVELGDIDVVVLEPNRHNGKSVKDGKVYNSSPNDVYVVDASWNRLIIRNDGFAVRGHFRLQPCGPDMRDRKLIWIDAFLKNGYTRRPKASILTNAD